MCSKGCSRTPTHARQGHIRTGPGGGAARQAQGQGGHRASLECFGAAAEPRVEGKGFGDSDRGTLKSSRLQQKVPQRGMTSWQGSGMESYTEAEQDSQTSWEGGMTPTHSTAATKLGLWGPGCESLELFLRSDQTHCVTPGSSTAAEQGCSADKGQSRQFSLPNPTKTSTSKAKKGIWSRRMLKPKLGLSCEHFVGKHVGLLPSKPSAAHPAGSVLSGQIL